MLYRVEDWGSSEFLQFRSTDHCFDFLENVKEIPKETLEKLRNGKKIIRTIPEGDGTITKIIVYPQTRVGMGYSIQIVDANFYQEEATVSLIINNDLKGVPFIDPNICKSAIWFTVKRKEVYNDFYSH